MNSNKIYLALVLILVIFIIGCAEQQKTDSTQGLEPLDKLSSDILQTTDFEEDKMYEIKKDCSDVYFTHYLVEPSLLKVVNPIGMVHGSGTTIVHRSYVMIKDSIEDKVPIYAPTDLVLTSGSYYTMGGDGLPDYALDFDVGCGYTMSLAHLKEVIPEIESRFPVLSTSSATNMVEFLELEAGSLIGYYIPNEGVGAFDFIVNDASVTNKFPNQERYEYGYGSNILHGICPYDMYRGEMKQAYYDLLGGAGGTLFQENDCGTVSRDILGSISGQWSLDKEILREIHYTSKEGNYGSPLPIVGDEERITIGNLGNDKIWIYQNNPSYKNPDEVTDEHCYQIYPYFDDPIGYVYFKVVNDMEMKVYYSEVGLCPSSFPELGSKAYYR